MIGEPIHVEFIGLPGSGKTTIAQEVINQLTLAGGQCFSLSTKNNPEDAQKNKGGILSKFKTFFYFLNSIFNHPDIAYYSLLYSFHVKPFSLTNLNRGIILLVRLNSMKTIMRGDYDFIVFDQNLIQNIWSIGAASINSTNNKYFKRLLIRILNVTSPLIIYIDTEVDLTIRRINNRVSSRSRFDDMPPDQMKVLLNTHKFFFDRTINFVEENERIKYIKINGDQPIKKNVELIISFINQADRNKKNLSL